MNKYYKIYPIHHVLIFGHNIGTMRRKKRVPNRPVICQTQILAILKSVNNLHLLRERQHREMFSLILGGHRSNSKLQQPATIHGADLPTQMQILPILILAQPQTVILGLLYSRAQLPRLPVRFQEPHQKYRTCNEILLVSRTSWY